MQPGQTSTFTCRACGYSFAAAHAAIANQPTCPKCRTFGQLVDASGNPVGGRQNVVRVPAGAAPYAARGGPVSYGDAEQNDYVEVAADVTYGKRTNSKAIINTVILLGLGLGIVLTLYFIVTSLKEDRAEQQKQEKEVVLDAKDFERAIDESVAKVRNMLAALPDAEVQETTNFEEAISAIRAGGGVSPGWEAPPKPGSPFRSHGFAVKMVVADRNNPGKTHLVQGFIMLLYYKTSEEVERAKSEIDRYLAGDTRNYGSFSNPSMWYAAYMGVDFKGELHSTLGRSMSAGAPASYKQFTDRMGSTMRDSLKD
ncbi:MAG: hypothetical protein KDB90_09050 [Planctomycetes bacterium]|nr:hypothetical protein [Planctomycetota bacterium]